LFLVLGYLSDGILYSMDSKYASAEILSRSVDLYHAIFAGDYARVSNALIQGADANVRYAKGMTPLLWALYLNNIKIVKCLRAHGADINLTDNDGRTPLLCAILWGRTAIAQYLLACGADSKICDCFGRTACSVAIDQGDTALFGQLLCEKSPYAYAMMLMTRTLTWSM